MLFLHILAFVIGLIIVAGTIISAIRTFVVPRGLPDRLTGAVFIGVRRLFDLWLRREKSYLKRDSVMTFFAPLSLLTLPVVWISLVLTGYTCLFWSLGVPQWSTAFTVSGSSILTLGFATASIPLGAFLTFSEAIIGLSLAALLIAYLPTMYTAFARREAAVTALETRAGSPPSPVEMIVRYKRLGRLDHIGDAWGSWEEWFFDIEESHTSLAPLIFYRSPQPDRSWVTAAGAVLDTAAIAASTLDLPRDPRADFCLRAGYLALRRIASLFAIDFNPEPSPDDPISVSRQEFDDLCTRLVEAGISLKADPDQSWRDFAGWRVNYDVVLIALADLTMAPPAPWSSDRVASIGYSSFSRRFRRN